MAIKIPPANPATPAHKGACAIEIEANGKLANPCRYQARPFTANAVMSQNGATSVPTSANGVMTSVTHGIATAFASSPTTDT